MRIKVVFLGLLLAACSLKPYKMDIHQGNSITPEMHDKLKLGMSKQQVRYVLGTPLISDVFHGDRWDYVYRFEHAGKVVETHQLTLNFIEGKLDRVDGDAPLAKLPSINAENTLASEEKIVELPPIVNATTPSAEPIALSSTEVAISNSIEQAVHVWAAAWSSKVALTYIACYAKSFKPDGVSRAAWEVSSYKHIRKSDTIKVSVQDLSVKIENNTFATATFLQLYKNGRHKSVVRKALKFEKIEGDWLIISEKILKQGIS
jgi:outer membrane protein assembly factor BamE